MRRPTLAGRHAANNNGAVFGSALGMKGAFFACNSLHNQARIFIDENSHEESS
jgi:hypothetical protein